MPVMVPAKADQAWRRGQAAQWLIWHELARQLGSGYRVFCNVAVRAGQAVDFVVQGPQGLVFLQTESAIADVHVPAQPGVFWTLRTKNYYFAGSLDSGQLAANARAVADAVNARLPPQFQGQARILGGGLLHVLPFTTTGFAHGLDLASAERRVLFQSDIAALDTWIDRAGAQAPAPPPPGPEAARRIAAALGELARPRSSGWAEWGARLKALFTPS